MKLVHASISENSTNGWSGDAKIGDQTGKEVCVRSWYSKPWNVMLRYPNITISKKASAVAVKLAKSNLVGYDQSNRNSLYKELKKNSFNVDAYIKSEVKTETDCSAFVYAVYCCFIPEMRTNNNAPVTSNMKQIFTKYGFVAHTGSKYLNGTNLMVGDILIKEGSHTAIATDGATAKTSPVNIIDTPALTSEVDKAITIIAKDVINGNWGNGAERRDKLYVAIQSRVNDLLS